MFTITEDAQQYIANLFVEQEHKDLALKITISNGGTPSAIVNFNFCYPKDLDKSYKKFPYKGFDVYIASDNFSYLEQSSVELKEEIGSKKLTILAPNAKGTPPQKDAPLEEHIKWTIASEISPQLSSHGGFVELIEITKDMDVVLNFGGGCQGCSSVKFTLKNGIEATLKAKYPQIRNVCDFTDHSNTENAYM